MPAENTPQAPTEAPPAAPAAAGPKSPAEALAAVQARQQGEQTPPAEPPKAEPPPEPPPENPKSKPITREEFEALSQADRKIWQQEQELKELRALKAESDLWSTDPVAAFEKYGGSVQHLLDRTLKDGEPGESEQVARLEKLIQQQQEAIQRLTQKDEINEKRSYFQRHADEAMALVKSSEDFLPASDAVEVYQAMTGAKYDMAADAESLVESHRKKTGRVLTPAEVAGMLRDKGSEMIERLRSLPPEVKARILGTDTPATQPQQNGGQPASSSLTNADESQSPPEDLASLSHDERLKALVKKYGAQMTKE